MCYNLLIAVINLMFRDYFKLSIYTIVEYTFIRPFKNLTPLMNYTEYKF
jgi:hypothetical protein